MEIIRLPPMARAEIKGAPPAFLEQAFQGLPPAVRTPIAGDDFVKAVLAGGYPQALTRRSWSRRQTWYLNYIEAIVQRDVRDVAQIEQTSQMPRLPRALARYSGQLVNYSSHQND